MAAAVAAATAVVAAAATAAVVAATVAVAAVANDLAAVSGAPQQPSHTLKGERDARKGQEYPYWYCSCVGRSTAARHSDHDRRR